MASQIDICNLALANLGDEATVSAINPPDGSAQAGHCARFYPIAIGVVLEAHSWNFATRRTVLSLLSVTPPASWAYAYALPSDCVRALSVLLPGETDDTNGQDFTIETDDTGTKMLYTSVGDAVLVYTRNVTDTTKYSPLFVNAAARLLSSYLAGPITKDLNIGKAMYQMYRAELAQATVSDANQRKTSSYKNFTPGSISARQ